MNKPFKIPILLFKQTVLRFVLSRAWCQKTNSGWCNSPLTSRLVFLQAGCRDTSGIYLSSNVFFYYHYCFKIIPLKLRACQTFLGRMGSFPVALTLHTDKSRESEHMRAHMPDACHVAWSRCAWRWVSREPASVSMSTRGAETVDSVPGNTSGDIVITLSFQPGEFARWSL